MRIIKDKTLREAAKEKSIDVQKAVEKWISVVKKVDWTCFEDVKKTYNRTDMVGDFLVFDLAGGHRLIISPSFSKKILFFKYLLSHAEYDTDSWKEDEYFDLSSRNKT